MADYTVEGNKIVHCNCGHECVIPFQQVTCECTDCGETLFIEFFGVVINKDGNYIY